MYEKEKPKIKRVAWEFKTTPQPQEERHQQVYQHTLVCVSVRSSVPSLSYECVPADAFGVPWKDTELREQESWTCPADKNVDLWQLSSSVTVACLEVKIPWNPFFGTPILMKNSWTHILHKSSREVLAMPSIYSPPSACMIHDSPLPLLHWWNLYQDTLVLII